MIAAAAQPAKGSKRWAGWLLAGLGAAGLASLGGRALERRWRLALDTLGPGTLVMPSGTETVVRTDDGAELATTIVGVGGGPTVVLSHGWTGSRVVWAPVAHRLVATGHRVVLYDQRGHGESTLGQELITGKRLGDDLAAVMAELDVRDAVLAGHSMGGFTVVAYAVQHAGDMRDRVRSLVLVATAARVIDTGALTEVTTNLIGGPLFGRAAGRPRLGLLFVRGAVGRRPRHSHLDVTRQLFRATPSQVRIDALRALRQEDLRERLEKVEVPTAVLTGRWDVLTPPWQGRELARALPSARFELLPDVGHMLPLEASHRVAIAIQELAD